MRPSEALKQYLDLLSQKQELDTHVQLAKEALMDSMQADGQLSMKTADAVVSIAKKVTPQINEIEFRHWVAENPSVPLDEFYQEVLDSKKVAMFSEKWKKETGEIVPYMTVKETEYLTVRPTNKKEEGEDVQKQKA